MRAVEIVSKSEAASKPERVSFSKAVRKHKLTLSWLQAEIGRLDNDLAALMLRLENLAEVYKSLAALAMPVREARRLEAQALI